MEHLQNIQDVFSDKILKVPDYQRGYAWDKEHWTDLIEDLEILVPEQEHYTGTLVLHQDTDKKSVQAKDGTLLKVFDIVDGQQRLTSIVILLNCIAQKLSEIPEKEEFANGIIKKYIKFIDMEEQERTRLTLNSDCHDFFKNTILASNKSISGPVIKSHERLQGASKYFMDYLEKEEKKGSDGFVKFLSELHKKITNQMMLTVYKVPEAADVGVIFEVMNNRGKPLSEMEKVKNFLLYISSKNKLNAAQELRDKINSVWARVFNRLMEAGIASSDYEDQLLRSSWLMAYDYMPRNWKGYSSIKEKFHLKKYIDEPEKMIDEVGDYIKLIDQTSIAYCDIFKPNRNDAYNNFCDQPKKRKKLQHLTEKIGRIGNIAPFLPLLMGARMKYPNDDEFSMELLTLCEKYAFRVYRLARSRSNAGQTALFKKGYDLFHGGLNQNLMLRSIKRTLLRYSPHEEFMSAFEEGRNWYNFYGLKYLLYEYEEFLSKGRGIKAPWEFFEKSDKKDTIEHILPQTPTDSYWLNRWPNEERDLYTHDIGNLTLTFDNSVYSNKSFPIKKGKPGQTACYANSSLFVEKALAQYNDWTPKELLKRRNEIRQWAKKRWFVEYIDDQEGEDSTEFIDDEEENDFVMQDIDDDEEEASDAIRKRKNKPWSRNELYEYLDYLNEYGEFSFYYLQILTEVKQIGFNELINKIKEISGKHFTGKMFAGVLSGMTRRTSSKGKEQLIFRKDDGWIFSLNQKYSKVLESYFSNYKK